MIKLQIGLALSVILALALVQVTHSLLITVTVAFIGLSLFNAYKLFRRGSNEPSPHAHRQDHGSGFYRRKSD